MEEKISKNLCCGGPLKYCMAVILAILLLALAASQIAGIKNNLWPVRTVVFTGTGKALGIPDVAVIQLTVITDKFTTKEAIADNSKQLNEMATFVKDSGVASKDVQTSGYYLSPRYDYPDGQRVFRGYTLTATLTVKIRDLSRVGEIIDGAVARGADQIGSIQFIIDDPSRLEDEARADAISAAQVKAQKTAVDLGWKLGKLVYFTEGVSEIPLPMYDMAFKSAGGGGAAPAIEQGSQEVNAYVSMTYEVR